MIKHFVDHLQFFQEHGKQQKVADEYHLGRILTWNIRQPLETLTVPIDTGLSAPSVVEVGSPAAGKFTLAHRPALGDMGAACGDMGVREVAPWSSVDASLLGAPESLKANLRSGLG